MLAKVTPRRRGMRQIAVLLTTVALAGCGGGGGVNSTPAPPTGSIPPPAPTPSPAPAPAPTPTPAPAPTSTPTSSADYDTAEYRATVGAVSMNALAGYERGATGAGVIVGIVDSGIDLQSDEFAGRVRDASTSVSGNPSIDDADGHGTAVAFTLAGRRNGGGTQGVAFDAGLVIARADTPGSCAGTASAGESSCSFDDVNIAKGLDLARNAGARVVNISLGGDDAAPPELTAAIDRATAAGIVVVISAGNNSRANPSNSALFANDNTVSRGLVIIAGSVGTGDALSSFSNRAGDSAAHFLAAIGERVRAPDATGTPLLWSGTSFSAPQIAGAVALLAQAFPNLSGAQIVDLLYRTARDVGAAGVDATYGRGVLDLTRAFQPVGVTTVAGQPGAMSLTSNGVLSAPMGDAKSGALGAVILDSYGRAFGIDLAQTIGRSRPMPTLTEALQARTRSMALDVNGTSAAMTITSATRGVSVIGAPLSTADVGAARVMAGRVIQRIGASAALGFAFRQAGGELTAQLTRERRPAFLVARDDNAGFTTDPRAASALRVEVAGTGVTGNIESGEVMAGRDPLIAGLTGWRRARYDSGGVTIDRQRGMLWASLGASRLGERGTVLGAQFDPALGGLRATSWFADGRVRMAPGKGWSVGGSLRQGWTRAAGGMSGTGRLRTGAWAMDLGKDGVFGRDTAGLRLAQPLRVASGGIALTLPTSWDYANSRVTNWTPQRIDLAPGGRELDAEARYGRALATGWIEGNLFWRRDPGNIAALNNDYGIAIRFSRGF